ncbi:MAG: universal stress protein [Cyclobacteriaceae bacterium]
MKTILVPTDFSAHAKVAVRYAIEIARQGNFKIVFQHSTFLLPPPRTAYTSYLKRVYHQRDMILKKLTHHIDKIYKELDINRDSHRTKLMVKHHPSVADSILETTREQFIDFIVMGTRGASGMKKFLFGSNTSAVIENSECPVLAIPYGHIFKKIQRIAFAAQNLKIEKKEIRKILSLAQGFGATIEIFHVVNELQSNRKAENVDIESQVTDLMSSLKYPKIKIHIDTERVDGDVSEGIETFVKQRKPDMLVMLTHKRGFWGKLFDKSKTTELVLRLKTPLLAIK